MYLRCSLFWLVLLCICLDQFVDITACQKKYLI